MAARRAAEPDGDTPHEVWVSNSAILGDLSGSTLIHTFSGFTFADDILTHTLPSPLSAQFVQIRTTESPSWFGWWEVQVLAVPEPSTLALAAVGILGLIAHARRRWFCSGG